MRITVLGGGAMGGLFGSYLSRNNDVTIIDVNEELVSAVEEQGMFITEPDGSMEHYRPHAAAGSAGMEAAELVIVFVKAMYSESALQNNRRIIGPDTYLMTLQNGSGHEEILLRFADADHVIIGTTQHNAKVEKIGVVHHGGRGCTMIGSLSGNNDRITAVCEAFNLCGLECRISGEVRRMIWDKLFTNVSASALTAVLNCPLGYIRSNDDAWELCGMLIKEAVEVARAEGLEFDYGEKLQEVAEVCSNSPGGITSICADMEAGRRTEVDTISGSIVRTGARNGVPTPGHAFILHLVHALERRPKCSRKEEGE